MGQLEEDSTAPDSHPTCWSDTDYTRHEQYSVNTELEVPVHMHLVKQPSVPQQETAGMSHSAPPQMGGFEEEEIIRAGLVVMHKISGEVVSAMHGSKRKLQAQNETLQQQVTELENKMSALKFQLKAEHQNITELEKVNTALKEKITRLKADCDIQHQKVAELEKVNAALKEENTQLKDSLEKKVDSLSTDEEELIEADWFPT